MTPDEKRHHVLDYERILYRPDQKLNEVEQQLASFPLLRSLNLEGGVFSSPYDVFVHSLTAVLRHSQSSMQELRGPYHSKMRGNFAEFQVALHLLSNLERFGWNNGCDTDEMVFYNLQGDQY